MLPSDVRVLHVTPTFAPQIGGIETVVASLANAGSAAGLACDIAHVAVGNDLAASTFDDGRRIWRVPMRGTRLVGLAPDLPRIIRDYDLIHVHDPHIMALTVNVMRSKGTRPAVLSTHGGFRHTRNLALFKTGHEALIMRPALARYAEILASSETDREYFSRYSDRVVAAPNGVTVEPFLDLPRTVSDPRRWIYWGRMAPNKRLDALIRLVGALRNAAIAIDLLICGDDRDDLRTALEADVAVRGLSGSIQFRGALDAPELAKEISTRGLFVTASEYEGFGLTVIEAMAAGLVVLCRDVAPLNGFVGDGANGALLRFDESDADMAKVANLVGTDGRAAIIADANRQKARLFSWNHAFAPFLASYARILGGSLGQFGHEQR